jgi:hypothetical protein
MPFLSAWVANPRTFNPSEVKSELSFFDSSDAIPTNTFQLQAFDPLKARPLEKIRRMLSGPNNVPRIGTALIELRFILQSMRSTFEERLTHVYRERRRATKGLRQRDGRRVTIPPKDFHHLAPAVEKRLTAAAKLCNDALLALPKFAADANALLNLTEALMLDSTTAHLCHQRRKYDFITFAR